VGFAFALPDFLNTFLPAQQHPGIAPGAIVVSLAVGILLWLHGWYRAKHPLPALDGNKALLWARRIAICGGCVIVTGLICYTAWKYFFG
jgi:hypothetical protein